MNFSTTLFRCSSLGHIMTEPKTKSEPLSETCKTHLIDIYVASKYDRHTDIANKYIQKGLQCEEDSITLYSRLRKNFFKKNADRITNEYLSGHPDLFTGPEIMKAETIIDLKTSWDIYTFFRVHTHSLNKMYYWQLQGYMALTGAKSAKLVYCLVNTPEPLINDEKRKLLWKMGVSTDENSDYIEACALLEKNMKFEDIPMSERVIEIEIERNDVDIEKVYQRIETCRGYLQQLENQLNPSAIIAEYDSEASVTVLQETRA